MPHSLDHAANTYIAVTLAPNSPYQTQPTGLAQHQAVSYVGPVGELSDVQLVAVPKGQWDAQEADVLGWLKTRSGVAGVQVQAPPKVRVKRGGEDL